MPLVVVLFLVLLLLCAGGIVIWTRLAAANTRRIDRPEGDFEEFFWGGVMCRHVVTSGSLARLEFFDWGVRLRGIPISRWIVPTWEARYDELAVTELVSLPYSRVAVWLRIRGEHDAIAFLCDRYTSVLGSFEKHGVTTDTSVTQIRKVEELYQ